jgi:hypothetical protein
MLMHPFPNPDELTSHSTKAGKGACQVAGYPPVGEGVNLGYPDICPLSLRRRVREGVVEHSQNWQHQPAKSKSHHIALANK